MNKPSYYQVYHKHGSESHRYNKDSPVTYKNYFKEFDKLACKGIPQICCTMEHSYQGPYWKIYDDLETWNSQRQSNKKKKPKELTYVEGYKPMKFIFGTEAYWVEDRFEKDSANNHIVLLAKNDNGRKKINRAIYESFKTGYYFKNRMDLDILLSLPQDDVFVTSACLAYWMKYATDDMLPFDDNGNPNTELNWTRIDEITLKLFNHFTDFYLEVQANNTDKQKIINKHIMELHYTYGIPIISATDSHYINESQFEDREDLLKSNKISYPEEDGWFMDVPDLDTLIQRFVDQGVLTLDEIYEAIENTNKILEFEDIVLDRSLKVPVPKKYRHLPLADRNEVFKQILRDEWNAQKSDINQDKFDEYISEIRNGIEETIGCNMADYFLCNYEIMNKGQAEYGGILTPSGRGCFTEDALVHTNKEMKSIKDINIGDYVVTRDGLFNKVLDKMSYEIEEELVKIQHLYGTNKNNPAICTLDHKILTKEGWKCAKDLTKSDFVCVPKMKNKVETNIVIDLNKYNNFGYAYDDEYIYEVMKTFPSGWDYSFAEIEKNGIATPWEIKLFIDLDYTPKNERIALAFERILEYIPFKTREEYVQHFDKLRTKKIKRYLTLDESVNEFIGLMYGDGFTSGKGHCVGLAINETSKCKENRECFYKFAEKVGISNHCYENKSKTKNLTQMYINSNLIRGFVCEFLFESKKGKEKVFNEILFNQPKECLSSIIKGLRESDGSIGKDGRISFDNNSTSLINAYKLLCLMTEEGVNSLISRKPYQTKEGYNCNASYKLRIGNTKPIEDENYYYLPVTNIEILSKQKAIVYDITVENEHNYLLNNMIVHNSGVGFYLNKLLKFTKVDKVNSPVLMYSERFLTKERIIDSHTAPDIDHNVSDRQPFIQAQRDVIGEEGTYDLIAFGTLKYKSAFKMYARAYNVDPQLANEVTKQITKYEEALKYAEEEDRDLIDVFDYVDKEKYGYLIEGCQEYLGIVDNLKSHPCFTKNELVMTESGYKPISEIKVGEKVLTIDNSFRYVMNTMVHESEDIYNLDITGTPTIEVTGNHPLYTSRRKYINKSNPKGTDRRELLNKEWKSVDSLVDGDLIGSSVNQNSILPEIPFVDSNNLDFWWCIGRYLGDGWRSHTVRKSGGRKGDKCRYVIICCNKDENKNETLDINSHLTWCDYRVSPEKTTNKIYLKQKGLYEWIECFGDYAKNKYIPNFVLDLPTPQLKSLLEGYFSADGYYDEKTNRQTFNTVSKKLALGIASCVHKVYKVPCTVRMSIGEGIDIIERREVNRSTKYKGCFVYEDKPQNRCFYQDGIMWFPFRKREKLNKSDNVYNLSVEGNHTYTVNNLIVHNCGTICYDGDAVEDIGVIMVKSETTKKETWVAVIESGTIDAFGFLKQDYLIVDSIGLMYEVYKEMGVEPMTVNQLLEAIDGDEETWRMYREGFTMCVNQCEQPKSTQKVMRYKPQNISELTQFIAGIRPSFKKMYKKFENREHFEYGIKAFDSLIQDAYCESSFILYQEHLMKVLGFAHFPMGDTYTIIKAISKKKEEKILQAKEKFVPLFAEAIIDTGETSDRQEALRLSEEVWKIIEDSAQYGFNSAHAYCMAIDSVTLAWQKAHYPMEFYKVALQWYTNKGNKNKVAKLKKEMNKRGFKLNPIRFGDDNRTFSINREQNYIAQTMSSIKDMQKVVPDIMYELGKRQYSHVFELFKAIKETEINQKSLGILMKLDYFKDFGTIPEIIAKHKIYLELCKVVDKLRTCKQLSKDYCDLIGLPLEEVIACAENETPKQLRSIDNDKLIGVFNKHYSRVLEIISAEFPYEEDIELIDKMSYQAELMSYVDLVDSNLSDDIYIVEEMEINKYGTPFITIYQACSGIEIESIKIERKWFAEYPCKAGNILRCAFKTKEKKMKAEKDPNDTSTKDKWIGTGEYEEVLDCYTIIETL